MKHLFFTFVLAASGFLNSQAATVSKGPQPNKLWYNKPAYAFEESLPIGNGKLGALVYGGANNDSIQLNDITLWTGVPVDPNEGGEAYKWIPKIREALFKEDYKTADSLQHYVQGHNSEFYQPLGMISIKDCNQSKFTDYYRELSLDNSLATVHYKRNGIQYSKEYFASHPDKMIAIKLSASQKRAINCDISLTSLIPHQVKASRGQLTMTGHVLGDEANSTHYCAMLQVKNTDGKLWASDSILHLKDVSEAIIYLINETSYNGFDKHPVKEGAPYIENVADDAWHLANFTYDEFKQRHIADYKKLFDRVSLSLKGAKFDATRPTDRQLLAYSDNHESNPYLEQLYFQYGRYLLISSSRTKGVPANLQGLWARLHRADKAYQIYRKLLTYVSPEAYKDSKHRSGGTYPNLFDAHPPFQIDGNFGGTAGICEMLMQCDGETMNLLPALPQEWKTGEMKGLKARGNYGVSFAWNNGKLTRASISSKNEGNLTVNYNGKQKVLSFKAGETKIIK